MYETYPVYLGSQQVGKVQVQRQGLYCRFYCQCRIPGKTIYRLQMSCGERRENLGILIPAEQGFGLETRIPAKRVGDCPPEFRLVPKHDPLSGGRFVPISPEEPFSYLARLKDSFLTIQDGQKGIVIPED